MSDVPCIDSRNHSARAERFHKQNEGHDGEDVVVRRERGEPMYGEIADPDYQYWQVDGKDP